MSDRTQAGPWEQVGKSTEEILNVRAEVARRQPRLAALTDRLGQTLAHPRIFLGLLLAHILWVLLNLRIYPWLEPWDPYPFTFLATIASVEAPFIALMVLMHRERDRRIQELREEINLQVSLHVERELTAVLQMIREIQESQNVESEVDREVLERMQTPLHPDQLMERLRKHLESTEGEPGGYR